MKSWLNVLGRENTNYRRDRTSDEIRYTRGEIIQHDMQRGEDQN